MPSDPITINLFRPCPTRGKRAQRRSARCRPLEEDGHDQLGPGCHTRRGSRHHDAARSIHAGIVGLRELAYVFAAAIGAMPPMVVRACRLLEQLAGPLCGVNSQCVLLPRIADRHSTVYPRASNIPSRWQTEVLASAREHLPQVRS